MVSVQTVQYCTCVFSICFQEWDPKDMEYAKVVIIYLEFAHIFMAQILMCYDYV